MKRQKIEDVALLLQVCARAQRCCSSSSTDGAWHGHGPHRRPTLTTLPCRHLLKIPQPSRVQGAIQGKKAVGLKLNCPTSKLTEITQRLPSEQSPTVSAVRGWAPLHVAWAPGAGHPLGQPTR